MDINIVEIKSDFCCKDLENDVKMGRVKVFSVNGKLRYQIFVTGQGFKATGFCPNCMFDAPPEIKERLK